MAKKYPGIYLYYDWIDALSALPAAKAMKVIKNLRAYAEYDTEPPPMDGPAGYMQALFISQLRRSKINAENGRLGGIPKHKSPSAASKKNDAEDGTLRFMTQEEIDGVAYTDYLKLRSRFNKEEQEAANAVQEALEEDYEIPSLYRF